MKVQPGTPRYTNSERQTNKLGLELNSFEPSCCEATVLTMGRGCHNDGNVPKGSPAVVGIGEETTVRSRDGVSSWSTPQRYCGEWARRDLKESLQMIYRS